MRNIVRLVKANKFKLGKLRINKKGARIMENVYQGNKISIEIKPYSFSEMIMDEEKRLASYKFYDDNYEQTDEEKEIFNNSRRRRM